MTTVNLKKRSPCSGYTLVEVLAAFTLFTVAIGPALWIVTNATNTTVLIQNNLIAANLAQEGLEVIHAMRDTAWLEGQTLQDYRLCGPVNCPVGQDYVVRVEYDSDESLPLNGNPPLKLDKTTGVYSYETGDETIFKRQITINKVSDNETKVISRVDWNERGSDKNITLESHLFNWNQ